MRSNLQPEFVVHGMFSRFTSRAVLKLLLCLLASIFASVAPGWAQIRDGNIDPANIGKGDWIYFMSAATNQLGYNVPTVTNETSLMRFYRSQGVEWIVVKAATSDELFNGSYSFPQFNSNLVNIAHAEGIKIFGYNRSYGSNVLGEAAIADYVFNEGADGFVFDAEAEWESNRSWIGANGPAKANQLCSIVRSNWPNKFLAHAPLPIISYHSSFPYKEFGYWCDVVMPQDYWTSIGISPESMVQWRNSEWHSWENSLSGIWTNAIKPLAPLGQGWSPSASEILTPEEITRFFTALREDPRPPGKAPYSGISFWRADLHTAGMWDAIRTNSIFDPTTNPPDITVQPQDATVLPGSTVSFSVTTTGSAPLSYQWLREGTNIPGAIEKTYTKTYVQPADAGKYSVVVSNKFGTDVSSNAVLTVNVPPTISSGPEEQWVSAGDTVTFSINVTGTDPMTYQWLFNETNNVGQSKPTYTIPAVGLSAAGAYSVVVSNVAGMATSAVVQLTVTLQPVAPFITTQPADEKIALGKTAEFEVKARGTTPLSYYWRFYGTNLNGATSNKLVIPNITSDKTGPYSVLVSNSVGTNLSRTAVLSLGNSLQAVPLWAIPGGERVYLGTASQYERGMAYDRLKDRLLVLSRAAGSAEIYVLNGTTGEDLHNLYVDPTVVSGGTYVLNMIGVADDGVVYAANLAASGSGFKIYRWDNDEPWPVPTVAFNGDPAPSDTQRWGDTLNVRGSGKNTQILIGSRNGQAVAVLTTLDGFNFAAQSFAVAELPAGGAGLGIAFGPGNTFYAKGAALPLVRASFDLSTGGSAVLRTFTAEEFPTSVVPIGVDSQRSLLAGIHFGTPDTLDIYDITFPDMAPVPLATNAFASDNPNGFSTGSVDFGNDRVYALNSNNGLLALDLVSDTPPVVTLQPANQSVIEGSRVEFKALASGSRPIECQWRFYGTNLPGQTNFTLVIASATTNTAGPYRAFFTNQFGTATSEVAVLSVRPGISLTAALDAADLSWETGGATNWFGQTNVTYDGIDAAQSGSITNSESTWLKTTVTGPGYLTFIWKVSSEGGWDYVTFTVDGVQLGSISGETDWTSFYTELAAGTHELMWTYAKDSVLSAGEDKAWLDEVHWVGPCGNCAPEIAQQPASIRTVQGAPVQLTVKAGGTEPLHYQWKFNNTDRPNETNATFSMSSVTLADAGAYSVLITNDFGFVLSSNAVLEVVPAVASVFDDFDPGIDMSQWFGFGGTPGLDVAASNIGGSVSGTKSLWFGGENTRYAISAPVATGSSGIISYFLRYGNSNTQGWEVVDLPSESVVLESSLDGGVTWTQLTNHNNTVFFNWTLVSMNIPASARSSATLFRWRQLSHSGSCCDQWALEDVRIQPGAAAPTIAQAPQNLTIMAGRIARFTVGAWGTQPLTYRWYFGDQLLPWATESTLAITNVQQVNSGAYSVSVSNAYGADGRENILLTVTPRPPCIPADPSMVAWWRGEEDVRDSVGLNDLVPYGSTQPMGLFAEGIVDTAFTLQGSLLRTAAAASLDLSAGTGFTVEGWIYPKSSSAYQQCIAEWAETSSPYRVGAGLSLGSTSGQLYLQAAFTTSNSVAKVVRAAPGAVTINAWQHVALTYNQASGLASIYLNGTPILQTNIGPQRLITAVPFSIGGRQSTGYYFVGLLDEFCLYSRDLARTDIQAIYASGAGGKCAPAPLACTPLPAGAVAWWMGQNNQDDILSANDALWLGSQYQPYYTNGRVATAWNLNGSALRVPASADLDVGAESGATVEGWVKPYLNYANAPFFEWNDGFGRVGLGVLLTGQGLLEATLTATNSIAKVLRSPANVVGIGSWSHIALTYDKASGQAVLYVNGSECARTNAGMIRPATGTDVYFGYRRSGNFSGARLYGGLDDFTIYKRALASAEIRAIALSRETGKCLLPTTCALAPAGFVGWWQGESNAVNRLPGLNGIAGTMYYSTGKVGAAFSFTRSGANVRVPAASALNVGLGAGLTVECWIQPNTVNGPIAEWNNRTNAIGTRFWLIEPNTGVTLPGQLTANLVDTAGVSHFVRSLAGAVTNYAWQHVALTYDKPSGIAGLYVNGHPVALTNLGSFTPQTSYDLHFGYRPSGPFANLSFNGSMDELSLYSRALTAAELRSIVLGRSLGKCDDPPVIVRQPQSIKVNEGETARFEAEAAGTPPLFYTWKWDMTRILTNEVSPVLVLTNVQYSDHGVYNLTVTNVFGSAMSTGATLTVNRAPVANAQKLEATEDMPLAITLNGSDADLDLLTFKVTLPPSHGVLSGSVPDLVFTPAQDYSGADSFAFVASDGSTNSLPAVVEISVAPVNDPPVAYAQSVTIDEDTSTNIQLAAADPDGDALQLSILTPPAHGTLSAIQSAAAGSQLAGGRSFVRKAALRSGWQVTYMPSTNYNGADSFSFQASDGKSVSAPGLVTISVSPVNDPPVPVISITPLAVFPNITNLITIATNGAEATVKLDGSGSTDVENDPLSLDWFLGTNWISSDTVVTGALPVGSHEITLIASDGRLSATNSAALEVITSSESVLLIMELIKDSGLSLKQQQPLLATLNAAMGSFDRGSTTSALNQLQALQNKVAAQFGRTRPELASQILQGIDAVLESWEPPEQLQN